MLRRVWPVIGAAFALAVGYVAWRETIPRIGSATPAEVMALVPRELREPPPADPVAEARFVAATRVEGEDRFGRMAALVAEGPWRVPARTLGHNVEWPLEGFETALADRIVWAARTGDRRTCAETVALAFRFVRAYAGASGDLTDAGSATEMLSPIADAVEDALRRGGLTAADRSRLCALVPPDDGRGAVADAVATQFRAVTLPSLLRAAKGARGLANVLASTERPANDPGTYDPLETTRLVAAFAQADRAACRGAARDARLLARMAALRAGLPEEPPKSAKPWDRFRYRWSANHGPNTLGRAWVLPAKPFPGAELADARAKAWARLRKALSK